MGTPIDVADLVRRVEVLERALGVVPQQRPVVGPFIPTFLPKAKYACGRCGIDLGGVMGYVCPVTDCPTMPRVTCGT